MVRVINPFLEQESAEGWTPAVNGKMPIHAWVPTRSGIADDLVGANDGTLTNGASIVSDTGAGGAAAFDLDGTNDLVDIGSGINPTAFSWSIWFFSTGGANEGLISDAGGVGVSNVLNVRNVASPNGNLSFRLNGGSGTIIGATGVNNAAWHHAVATYDGSHMRLYLDGASNATAVSYSTAVTWSGNLVFGRYNSATQSFDGLIDDVRIWDQAIDATDVADLYAAQRGGQA